MKSRIISIVFIFISLHSYSQSLSYGFGIGLNGSNLIQDGYNLKNTDYKPGFQLNAILKYNFNEKLKINFEPGFANRGGIHNDSDTAKIKTNLNYLILPITANYMLFNKFSIFIGSEFAYRISAKNKYAGKKYNVNFIYDRKIDVGIIAGFSYQIFDKFNIGIRYNRGFISTSGDILITDDQGFHNGKLNIFNQGFTLSVSYMIN